MILIGHLRCRFLSWPALLLLAGLRCAGAAPIALDDGSFNVDLVYENVPIGATSVVTGTVDDDSAPGQPPELRSGGDDRTWVETGLVVRGSTSVGLPSDGMLTADGVTWRLRPYTQNNALQLRNYGSGAPLSGTMTLKPEARIPYERLDVLHASAPNNALYGIILTFTDGSSVDLGQNFFLNQWSSTDPNGQVILGNRVSANVSNPAPFPATIRAGNDDGIAWGGQWSAYHLTLDLAARGLNTKALRSVTFTSRSSTNYSVLAISGVSLTSSPPPPPTLSIQRSGQAGELTWEYGALQSADEVGGTWSDVVGAASPYVVNLSPPRRFFRLRF